MIPVKEFFTAGRAVFTLEIPKDFSDNFNTKSHYTFKIKSKENKNEPNSYFVYLLSGPDNNSNYTYMGVLNPETGAFALTNKSKVTDDCWSVRLFRRVMANIFQDTPEAIVSAGFNLHHEGRCGKCGKRLTVPESVKTGLGPICSNF